MSELLTDLGAICGRFQPFHLGHAEYLCAAKKRCQKLLIGITNPDPGSWAVLSEAPHRHLQESNPFTYYERMEMIRAALPDFGISDGEVTFVPFPILHPRLLEYYVPKTARVFVTIYDAWGTTRVELIRSEGFAVEILWHKKDSDRITSGFEIRDAIRNKRSWHQLVPKGAARVIESITLGRQI